MMFGLRPPRPERRTPVFAGAADPVDHDAVRAADPYAFEAAHRRLAWMFRISAMTNVGLIGVAIVLASAIAELVPLKEVRPALLRVDQSDNRLYRVEPITRDVEGFDLLMEQMARRYVRLLLEIDGPTQGDRLKEASWYSDPEFYKRFKKERIDSGEIGKALDSGLTRAITVESADRISVRNGVSRYAVDLVQTDSREGKVVETRKLRAYLALTSRPNTVREAEKYENPLGLRVLDLVLKERSNS